MCFEGYLADISSKLDDPVDASLLTRFTAAATVCWSCSYCWR